MDLDVSAADVARSLGRAPVPFTHSPDRELTKADLVRLEVEQGIKAPQVQRLSDRHHALAKTLAEGISPGNASISTGYSLSRISILKADPAFQELCAFYRTEKDVLESRVIDRLSNLTLSAVSLLEDRLEDAPEEIRTRELLDIATAGLDRTGYGPSSKVSVTSLTLTAEDMKKLTAATEEKNVVVIEGRKACTPAGGSDISVPLSLALGEEPEGLEGQGDGIREECGAEAPAVGQSGPGGGTPLRPVAEVQGLTGGGPCSAGSLHSVSGADHPDRVQTETEYLSGGSAPPPVQASAGVPLQAPGVHDPGVQALEVQAE